MRLTVCAGIPFYGRSLRDDIGPRLVADGKEHRVGRSGRGAAIKKEESKKPKAGGKVARVVEGQVAFIIVTGEEFACHFGPTRDVDGTSDAGTTRAGSSPCSRSATSASCSAASSR